MIQFGASTAVFICREPIDFRKGIDGLAGVCKYQLDRDPFDGGVFVFTNRARKGIKILFYDGQGFWVCHKRLSQGRFNWWARGELCQEMAAKELSVLIWNGDPEGARLQENWIRRAAQ